MENRSETKRALIARQREWLNEVVKAVGTSPSRMAKDAGVSDTTITRLLNNPDYDRALSPVVIERIKEAHKVPGPEEYASVRGTRAWIGLSEAERFDQSAEPERLATIVAAMLGNRNTIDPWRLKTDALVEAGYLAGDIAFVDLNASPEPQDVVCAQIYDWQRGRAETVFRVYDPPYLVAAAHDRTAYKPLLVDSDRVVIKGVVVESWRPHRLSEIR